MPQTADVVIIGARIIGGSIAFHLLERDPRLRVVMLEKESEPGTGATSDTLDAVCRAAALRVPPTGRGPGDAGRRGRA